MSRPQVLIGVCEGCSASEGIWHPHLEAVCCSDCAANRDNLDSARSHLFDLITPLVTAWREHWVARGVEPELLEVTLQNFDGLVDMVKALNIRANAETAATSEPAA